MDPNARMRRWAASLQNGEACTEISLSRCCSRGTHREVRCAVLSEHSLRYRCRCRGQVCCFQQPGLRGTWMLLSKRKPQRSLVYDTG